MKERSTHPETITPYLTRFYNSEQELLQEMQRILSEDPACEKAELFRRLSMKKGTGKSHVSRYQADHYDGERKD